MDLRKVMEEYYLFMKVEKTASVKTIYAYRSDLNQLADFLEKNNLNPFTVDAISQPLIHKFLLYLGENFDYIPATLSRRVNCLRSFTKLMTCGFRIKLCFTCLRTPVCEEQSFSPCPGIIWILRIRRLQS